MKKGAWLLCSLTYAFDLRHNFFRLLPNSAYKVVCEFFVLAEFRARGVIPAAKCNITETIRCSRFFYDFILLSQIQQIPFIRNPFIVQNINLATRKGGPIFVFASLCFYAFPDDFFSFFNLKRWQKTKWRH